MLNMQEVNQLEEKGESAFKQEFDRMEGGTGVVEIRKMPRLIQAVLGRDARTWITDRILKMLESNRDGKVHNIDWTNLVDNNARSTCKCMRVN